MIRFHSLLAIAFSIIILTPSCTSDGPSQEENSEDNTLRVQQPTDVRTMNPLFGGSKYETAVYKLVFQELMDFDPSTQALTPKIVKSDPIIEEITTGEYAGGLKFTYEILDEATWDDGLPITGNDFLFSMKTVFNPKLPTTSLAAYFDNVVNIEVDDNNPKKFSVYTDNAYILTKPGISNFVILPEHVYDPEGLSKDIPFADLRKPENAKKYAEDENIAQFATAFSDPKFEKETVVGSGPYKLVAWEPGDQVVLAKKQNWWGEKLAGSNIHLEAHPDTIIFYPIQDQSATIAALKDEKIDVSGEIDSRMFLDLRQNEYASSIFNFFTPPTYTYFMTIINTRNPKLSDKRVRRALAHLIDMDLVISEVYNGLGARMVSPVFPEKPYFNNDLKPIEYDLEKAKALLKEAGWEDSNGNGILDKMIDGTRTELSLDYQYNPSSNFQENYTALLKDNAQKAGIEINRKGLEFKAMQQNSVNGDYELGGRGSRWFPLPDDFKQLWHTDGIGVRSGNYPRFGNAESDALIEAIRYNPDEAERNNQYKQFQEIVYDEQPVIFILVPLARVAVHKRFDPMLGQMGLSYQHFKLNTQP
ncbi:MAG: ABC transporter substrate-binding protein [Bacteroidota bacterium]